MPAEANLEKQTQQVSHNLNDADHSVDSKGVAEIDDLEKGESFSPLDEKEIEDGQYDRTMPRPASHPSRKSNDDPEQEDTPRSRRGTWLTETASDGVRGGVPPHRVVSKEPDGTLIVGFEGEDDPELALNFSFGRRWIILTIICLGSSCVTCASSMVGSTYEGMQRSLHVSLEVATLGLSIFVAGLGLGPLIMGPTSERFGRNPIYRLSFVAFTLLNIPVALAPNIAVFLVFRFLTGITGSAFLSVAGGSVADLFRPHEVGFPMAVYTVSPFSGPILGPIVAGFINQNTTWRWTWYLLLIWSGAQTAGLYFLVPETYGPALLRSKAKRLRISTGNPNFKAVVELDRRPMSLVILKSCYRPFEILILEPMALLLSLYTATLLGILYAFFSAFPLVFKRHGFNLQCTGLTFIGVGLGFFLGTLVSPLFHKEYQRTAKRLGHAPGPEEHLKKAMVGGLICPAALLWFAFTTYPSVHWIVPILATIPFGVGFILIYQAVFTFLVSAYRPYAASAMAANSLLRSSFAAGFPLFTVQMYNALHPEWASALCAFLCLALAPLGFVFYKLGPRLRKQSKFSETAAIS